MPNQTNQLKNDNENLDKRYAKEVKSMLEVVRRSENTYVFLIAKHKDDTQNTIRKVPARRGLPMGGYVFDSNSDCYLVKCSDFLAVGYVPISFKLEMRGMKNWAIEVPVPDAIVRKHLSPQQRLDVKRFMVGYDPAVFDFEFVQLLGSH